MDESDRRVLGPVNPDSPPSPGSVSVVIVTYQSEAFIGRVLDLLLSCDEGPDEIIVVDNASTDATRQIADRPGVRLIASKDNLGFAGGCHAGVDAAKGETIVFLGHDTIPRRGWLTPLVEAANTPGVGAAMATIEDEESPGRFNTSGGHLTYYGIAWVSDLGERIPESEPELIDVAFPSGAAMAIRRDVWNRFEGFRASFFMYHEDSDLGWRLRLAQLRVVRVSRSRVSHDYDFSRTPSKMYWLERNRHTLLATNYRTSTRLLLAPAFLVAELGVVFVAVRDGWFPQKVAAWRDYLGSRSARVSDRRRVASIRVAGDAEILRTMDSSVSGMRPVQSPRGTWVTDRFFALYLRAVLPLVTRLDRRAGLPLRNL